MADILEIFTAAFWAEYGAIITRGIWETFIMTAVSTLFAYLIGLPMGVVCVLTDRKSVV